MSADSDPPSVLRAGVATADITPAKLFTNWVNQEPYPGVLDPLSVRVLALEYSGERALIVTLDVMETHLSFVGRIRTALWNRLGVPQGRILINASHSHSAPHCPSVLEELTPAQAREIPCLLKDRDYTDWGRDLEETVVDCASKAWAQRRSAVVSILRIHAGEWVYNRRPIQPDGTVITDFTPDNPYAQSGGRRFGPGDPTLTALCFSDPAGQPISTLLHFACHPVAIYPSDKRISADWPGLLREELSAGPSGLPFFLQGCAGDQVPIRRGLPAARAMAGALAQRLRSAVDCQAPLAAEPPRSASETLELPLSNPGPGFATRPAEVQVLTLGPLALVALPGEPLIGLALEIQSRSPFPHTLCLGYSNGHGTAYVPLPADKARGGYEARPDISPGTSDCGQLLVEAAVRLLEKLWASREAPAG